MIHLFKDMLWTAPPPVDQELSKSTLKGVDSRSARILHVFAAEVEKNTSAAKPLIRLPLV